MNTGSALPPPATIQPHRPHQKVGPPTHEAHPSGPPAGEAGRFRPAARPDGTSRASSTPEGHHTPRALPAPQTATGAQPDTGRTARTAGNVQVQHTAAAPAPCPHPPTICLACRGDGQGLDGSPETAADERTGGTQDRRRDHATAHRDHRRPPGGQRAVETPRPGNCACPPPRGPHHKEQRRKGRPAWSVSQVRPRQTTVPSRADRADSCTGPGPDPGATTPDMRARPHRPTATPAGRDGAGGTGPAGRSFLPAPRQHALPGRGGTGCFPAVPAVTESGSFTPMVRRWSGR